MRKLLAALLACGLASTEARANSARMDCDGTQTIADGRNYLDCGIHLTASSPMNGVVTVQVALDGPGSLLSSRVLIPMNGTAGRGEVRWISSTKGGRVTLTAAAPGFPTIRSSFNTIAAASGPAGSGKPLTLDRTQSVVVNVWMQKCTNACTWVAASEGTPVLVSEYDPKVLLPVSATAATDKQGRARFQFKYSAAGPLPNQAVFSTPSMGLTGKSKSGAVSRDGREIVVGLYAQAPAAPAPAAPPKAPSASAKPVALRLTASIKALPKNGANFAAAGELILHSDAPMTQDVAATAVNEGRGAVSLGSFKWASKGKTSASMAVSLSGPESSYRLRINIPGSTIPTTLISGSMTPPARAEAPKQAAGPYFTKCNFIVDPNWKLAPKGGLSAPVGLILDLGSNVPMKADLPISLSVKGPGALSPSEMVIPFKGRSAAIGRTLWTADKSGAVEVTLKTQDPPGAGQPGSGIRCDGAMVTFLGEGKERGPDKPKEKDKVNCGWGWTPLPMLDGKYRAKAYLYVNSNNALSEDVSVDLTDDGKGKLDGPVVTVPMKGRTNGWAEVNVVHPSANFQLNADLKKWGVKCHGKLRIVPPPPARCWIMASYSPWKTGGPNKADIRVRVESQEALGEDSDVTLTVDGDGKLSSGNLSLKTKGKTRQDSDAVTVHNSKDQFTVRANVRKLGLACESRLHFQPKKAPKLKTTVSVASLPMAGKNYRALVTVYTEADRALDEDLVAELKVSPDGGTSLSPASLRLPTRGRVRGEAQAVLTSPHQAGTIHVTLPAMDRQVFAHHFSFGDWGAQKGSDSAKAGSEKKK